MAKMGQATADKITRILRESSSSQERSTKRQREDDEMCKQKSDNHNARHELEQLKKLPQGDSRRAVARARSRLPEEQSRRCSEGGENAMEIQHLLVGRENTMYAWE